MFYAKAVASLASPIPQPLDGGQQKLLTAKENIQDQGQHPLDWIKPIMVMTVWGSGAI